MAKTKKTKLKITARALLDNDQAKELPSNYLKDLTKEINATMDAYLALDPPEDRTGVDFAVTISQDDSFLPLSDEDLLLYFLDAFRSMEYSQTVGSHHVGPPLDPDEDIKRFQVYRVELLARLNNKAVVFAAPADLMRHS
jgi:hypothetical protein